MIAIRSASRSTSARSWLVSRTVDAARRAGRASSSRVAARASTSMPAVGSSRIASSGRPTSARARPTAAAARRRTGGGSASAPPPPTARPVRGARRDRAASAWNRAWSPTTSPGGHPRVDPAAALEHQPDPRPVVAAGPRRIDAEHADRRRGRPGGSPRRSRRSSSCRRRSARAGRTISPARDPEREVAHDRPAAVRLAQAGDLDRRRGPVGDARVIRRRRSSRTAARSRRRSDRRSGSSGGSRPGRRSSSAAGRSTRYAALDRPSGSIDGRPGRAELLREGRGRARPGRPIRTPTITRPSPACSGGLLGEERHLLAAGDARRTPEVDERPAGRAGWRGRSARRRASSRGCSGPAGPWRSRPPPAAGRTSATKATIATVVTRATPTRAAIRRVGRRRGARPQPATPGSRPPVRRRLGRARRRRGVAGSVTGRGGSAADGQLPVHQRGMDRALELVRAGLQRRDVVGLLRDAR